MLTVSLKLYLMSYFGSFLPRPITDEAHQLIRRFDMKAGLIKLGSALTRITETLEGGQQYQHQLICFKTCSYIILD